VRKRGARVAAEQTAGTLRRDEVEAFWIHLDPDVLDDAVMPAVDYRLPGGMSWDELSVVLRSRGLVSCLVARLL
jgi:arginase